MIIAFSKRILIGRPKRKRSLWRPRRRRWEDNIKMDLIEVRYESVDWIGASDGLL
jgi:hypothetical protein